MSVAYVHASAGVSGPALLGALLDAGASLAAVQEGWRQLRLPAMQVALERVPLAEGTATRLHYTLPPRETVLGVGAFSDFLASLAVRGVPLRVRQRLQRVLTRFADAIARMTREQNRDLALRSPFLPEVVYLGSGVAMALEQLQVDRLLASPLNLGGGPVRPLTAELVRGVLVYGESTSEALTTPAGAAVLTALATDFGPLPRLTVVQTGYGVAEEASEQGRGLAVWLGEIADTAAAERIAVLEANIDDMNPEFYESVFERLLAQGALDVMLTPVLMKKQRPAHLLTVLAPLAAVPRLSRLMLCETSTFGVRVHETWRYKLERFHREVATRYGIVPVKCGVLDGRLVQAAPEYDACKRLAQEQGVPVRLVYAEATRHAAAWFA